MENVKLKKLDNGITLITENLPDISTFSMGFFVKTGAMNETKKECGISHFIEHLMFKGTKNRTAKELSLIHIFPRKKNIIHCCSFVFK